MAMSTHAARIPIHVRAPAEKFGSAANHYVQRKLTRKLGGSARDIERVSVRVEDVNGPRGGVDQRCRIKVVLRGRPSVVFESRDASLNAAVDVAMAGVQRAVRRNTTRWRTKPLRSLS